MARKETNPCEEKTVINRVVSAPQDRREPDCTAHKAAEEIEIL